MPYQVVDKVCVETNKSYRSYEKKRYLLKSGDFKINLA